MLRRECSLNVFWLRKLSVHVTSNVHVFIFCFVGTTTEGPNNHPCYQLGIGPAKSSIYTRSGISMRFITKGLCFLDSRTSFQARWENPSCLCSYQIPPPPPSSTPPPFIQAEWCKTCSCTPHVLDINIWALLSNHYFPYCPPVLLSGAFLGLHNQHSLSGALS